MTDAREIRLLREQIATERAARHSRRELQRLSAASSAASTIDDVAHAILDGVQGVLGAHISTIALPDVDAVRFVHVAATPDTIKERWRTAAPDTAIPLTRALEPGATWIELPTPGHFAEWPLLEAEAPEASIESYYVVPLRARVGTRPIAALGIGFPTPTELQPFDRAVLAEVCELAADAIERAQELQRTREVATAMQDSLLPARLPSVDGLWLRKLYEPSADHADVGGDWYDAVRLDDGAVALVIGDVAGHDVRSAAEMGKIRHVLASQLIVQGAPAVALTNTDRYFSSIGDSTYATALAVVVRADRCGGVIASAAHPPPLIVTDGGVAAIAVEPGPPLGSGLGGYRSTGFELAPGDAVVAYTDGVVERKGATIDESVSALASRISTSGARQPADLLRALRAHLEDPDRSDDAAALVAVRPLSEAAGVLTDPIEVTAEPVE